MTNNESQFSPSPTEVGYRLDRRQILKISGGVAGLAASGGLLAACGSDDADTSTTDDTGSGDGDDSPAETPSSGIALGEASGDLSIGSNYSNELPQAGLAAAVAALPNTNITSSINEVDHNTFQENISTLPAEPRRHHSVVRRVPHAVLCRPGTPR